ncbi:MAG: hypothetical protein ABJH68_08115 [Ilumatobacter sp.]|uniref:hypothetical protein n=1 Tax=Ilumatobacter sp. TaxID=1967498 RepID=UPI003296C810
MGSSDTREIDRRTLLGKLAAAGAVGWVAPTILSSSPAAAGIFTAKCAPGNVTATNAFVPVNCLNNGSNVTITITFNGPCPCGGTRIWCSQRNTPTTSASSTATVLSFLQFVPIGSVTITGRVALGCTDRDGDTQFARYDWSMVAFDNGNACNTAINSISGMTLSNRTLVTQPACATIVTAAAARSAQGEAPTGATRQTI